MNALLKDASYLWTHWPAYDTNANFNLAFWGLIFVVVTLMLWGSASRHGFAKGAVERIPPDVPDADFEFDRNSLFVRCYWGFYGTYPRTLCGLLPRTIYMIVTSFIGVVTVILLTLFSSNMLYWIWAVRQKIPYLGIAVSIAALGLLILVIVLSMTLTRLAYNSKATSILAEYIKAKKNHYCPKIQVR